MMKEMMMTARIVLAVFAMLAMIVSVSGRAMALEFQALPLQTDAAHDEGLTFSLQLPPSVQRFDRCESMLNHLRDTGALSAPQDNTPDNRGVAVVIGMRFALSAPAHRETHARLAVWEPVHGVTRQALAMSDYQDCRNEQALGAAFGN